MDGGDITGAGALSDADAGAGDLAGTGLLAELGDGLVDHAYAGGAEGVSHGEEAAVGVDGDVAGEGGAALDGGLPGLTEGEEVQGLDLLQLADGGGVVDLAEVDVLGAEAAHLVCLQGGGLGAVRAEGGVVGAAAVVLAGGEDSGGDGDGAVLVDAVAGQGLAGAEDGGGGNPRWWDSTGTG